MPKMKKKNGIESYGYDEVDAFVENSIINKETKDFIPFDSDDDKDASECDDMKAMGLPSDVPIEYSEDDDDDEEALQHSNRKDWGKKAANYYETNLNDDDVSDDSDHELQEQEAIEYQTTQLKSFKETDFGTEDLLLGLGNAEDHHHQKSINKKVVTTFENELEDILNCLEGATTDVEKIDESSSFKLKDLTQKEQKLFIKKNHSELIPLLKEMKTKSEEIVLKIQPILTKLEKKEMLTEEGLSFLEMKNHLLLCYLQYLVFYILLKVNGHSIENHPVIERLVELRLILSKLKPIEKKLQPQLSELLSFGETTTKNSKQLLKPRPDLLDSDGESSSSSSNGHHNDEVNSDFNDASSDVRDEIQKKDTEKIYKAPKLVSVEYTDNYTDKAKKKLERELERDEKNLKKSEIVAALREEFQETPLEFGGTALDLLTSTDKEARRLLQKKLERQEYEEEIMTRLPTKKADKKADRLLRKKQEAILSGGNHLDDLLSFADTAMDSTLTDPSFKITKLTKNLNSIQQAAMKINNKKDLKLADSHISARKVNRQKNHAVDADAHFGGGGGGGNNNDTSTLDVTPELPDMMKESIEMKLKKKDFKIKKYKEKQLDTLPSLDETIEGKRQINYQIDKNKGLHRKRKKIEGNARVHNRQKYEQKVKRFKGVQQTMREGKASGHYDGEASGIKTHVAKSIPLAS